MINQAYENMGLHNTQMMATIFDGISRHSPEGTNFKSRSEKEGWKKKIILVSSGMHILRLSSVFRSFDFEVISISVNDQVLNFIKEQKFWAKILPSNQGLEIFKRAFYTYSGIFYYLIKKRISFKDLINHEHNFLAIKN